MQCSRLVKSWINIELHSFTAYLNPSEKLYRSKMAEKLQESKMAHKSLYKWSEKTRKLIQIYRVA